MGQLVFQATLGGQVNLVGPNTASTFNLNVPAVSSTLATLTGTETFTNKTLTSPTLTTPVLGTPASGTLTSCTGLPVGGITATGTPSSTTYLRGDSTWATISTTTNAITNGTSNVTVNSSGGSITAATNGTTAITVDTSQNVGIGTASPSVKFEVSGTVVASGLNARITNTDTDASARAAIQFKTGASSNVWQTFAINGNLTTGVAGVANYMTLDSSGNLLVGGTTAGAKVRIETNLAPQDGLDIKNTSATTGQTFVAFFNSANGVAGTITQPTSTTVLFNTTSDYRLKTVVGAVTGHGARLDALKPIDYLWTDGGQQARGFLAHEFQEVYANSVTGTKDAVDTDGNPKYQAMQASSSEVIADLVAEIQSLRQRFVALETKSDTQAETINALTARIVALEAK
jgi:hypothetical protein